MEKSPRKLSAIKQKEKKRNHDKNINSVNEKAAKNN